MRVDHREIRAGFARWAWLLLLGCNGHLEVGDTMTSGGSGGVPSQGSGGGVSSGGVVQTLSQSDTASVIGTSKSCVAEPVMNGASCAEEGAVCGSWRTDSDGQWYSECGCYEVVGGGLQWSCYVESQGSNCPLSPPKAGASCFGNFGSECRYPVRTVCTCRQQEGWVCAGPLVPDYRSPPTTLNLAKPIVELSDAEREALCVWLADAQMGPGFPPEPPAQVGPDGFAISPGCEICSESQPNVMVPLLSLAQCAANLSFSTCAAPVSELVDCVATIYNRCLPSPHGCARYLERSGCMGTGVTTDGDPKSSSFCSVRVE